ncbi:MAG: hypothetical protein EOP10_20750 [Proteobacteria bacterium]|nr:MAG: hypothetical protein EOP10_20750 [Pseudomonadota bacterium]
MDGTRVALKLNLDPESLEILENLAGAQRCSLDEYVTGLVRKAIRSEQKTRRPGRGGLAQEAPMDAFLPEGVDPFETSDNHGLASSFADVQTRMRFAGTPSLFRETDQSPS